MKKVTFFIVPCTIWDPCSLTKDQTWAPCIGSAESYPLDHQGSPKSTFLCMKRSLITSHWRLRKYQHTKAENERGAITWGKMTVTCGRR